MTEPTLTTYLYTATIRCKPEYVKETGLVTAENQFGAECYVEDYYTTTYGECRVDVVIHPHITMDGRE